MNRTWLARTSLLIAMTLLVGTALGFELRSAENVLVAEGETVSNDLYAAGATVVIEGTVDGDLVAAAREVRVSGTVTGDVIAAAQTIVIDGELQDDARITGQVLYLREGASVQGHIVAAGFHLGVEPGASVQSDLAFGGRSVQFDGTLAGDGYFAVEAFHVSGAIGGDVQLWLDPSDAPSVRFGWTMDVPQMFRAWEAVPFFGDAPFLSSGVRFGDGARLGGNLTIVSERTWDIRSGVVAGEVSTMRPEEAEGLGTDALDAADRAEESPLLSRIRRFLALIVTGLLGLLLVPRYVAGGGERVRRSPWQSLGIGMLAIVAVPLILATVVGIVGVVAWLFDLVYLGSIGAAIAVIVAAVAFLIAALYAVALLFVVQPVVGHALGRWILQRTGRQADELSWAGLLIGLALIVLLTWIPTVGTALSALVAIFGLGGLMIAARRSPT